MRSESSEEAERGTLESDLNQPLLYLVDRRHQHCEQGEKDQCWKVGLRVSQQAVSAVCCAFGYRRQDAGLPGVPCVSQKQDCFLLTGQRQSRGSFRPSPSKCLCNAAVSPLRIFGWDIRRPKYHIHLTELRLPGRQLILASLWLSWVHDSKSLIMHSNT